MIDTQKSILIFDDQQHAIDALRVILINNSYIVHRVTSGHDAIQKAKKHLPHIILLDYVMPDMDGIRTCRELKKIEELESTLIVFYTNKTDETSELVAFSAGVDDYIKKPMNTRVLFKRLDARLRRMNNKSKNSNSEYYGFTIQKEKYCVQVGERMVNLPKKEMELFCFLADNYSSIVSREILLMQIWGKDSEPNERTIDVYVNRLRKKLGKGIIRTSKGVGYGIY
jgi:two-component system, OmpR family, alkaline phosphatase synthesis response regulator PhoP